MNLRADPRFEAYVEDAVTTVRSSLPKSDLKGDSILPLLLIGIASLSVANAFLTGGNAEALALEISGAAGLATLAFLCWLCQPRDESIRLRAVESARSPIRRRSLEGIRGSSAS